MGFDRFSKIKERLNKTFDKFVTQILNAQESILTDSGTNIDQEKFLRKIVNINSYITKLLGVLFITVFAFFPEMASNFFWTFLIIFVVMITIVIVLWILFPMASTIVSTVGKLLMRDPLFEFIKSVIIVLALLLLTIFLPSPNYQNTIGLTIGIIPMYIFFLTTFLLSFFIANLNFKKLIIALPIYTAFLYFIIPLAIFTTTTKSCVETISLFGYKIPIISNIIEQRSCERLTTSSVMKTGKEYVIPSDSGLGVQIGLNEMIPLPAGHSYKEVAFITNYYSENVSLTRIIPRIKSDYHNVIFTPTNYQQKKFNLMDGEVYGETLSFDPLQMEVDSKSRCIYTNETISKAGRSTECAYDVPCVSKGNYKSTCVQIGTFQCECVDWKEATCSGRPLRIMLEIEHTGFLNGNGVLYYFEDYTESSLPYYTYKQYPAEASFNFIPNPWFQSRYGGYIDEIQMFAQIKIDGKKPRITKMEIEPIGVIVSVNDEYKKIKTTESIGIKKKSCVNVEEINKALEEKGIWSGILCTFEPPSIDLKVENLMKGETLETSVSLAFINQYCNAQYLDVSKIPDIDKTSLEKYMESIKKINSLSKDIREKIDNYGLCSYLKEKREIEEKRKKELIEETLKKIEVSVRIEYITTESFVSREIYPYYTSVCDMGE